MINNINKTGQIFNTSNQNLVTQQQNSESISIFSDSSKKLSKEEKKLLNRQKKKNVIELKTIQTELFKADVKAQALVIAGYLLK